MAIINKPVIEKGVPAVVSLNKSELLAHPSVASNSYFSNMLTWKLVSVVYISSTGNQNKIMQFDAALSNPTTSILFSNNSRNLFQVEKIVIYDVDGGALQIPRSTLVVEDFDISL